jgi:hypothetical protein
MMGFVLLFSSRVSCVASDGGFEDFCYFSNWNSISSLHTSLSLSLSILVSIDEEKTKRESVPVSS